MKRILTACLSLGAALALTATAEAQDTTQTGAAPMPEDSAPTSQMGGDTLGGDSTRFGYPVDSTTQQNQPGYRGDSVSNGASPGASSGVAAPDSTSTGVAPDTTLPGDQSPRQPESPEERIHSDSAGADSSSS
ncbi:MAG TPA: hypothetical protein VJQ44_17410 [Gemmatimonadales bacterium]|nr:hypothetical protein [Gemmatimonadales bacterium]